MTVERLRVAYIAGAHGVQGGLRIQMHDPASKALRVGMKLDLVHKNGQSAGAFELTIFNPVPGKPGRYRAELTNVASREAVEAIRGCSIELLKTDLPALENDEFFISDAMGLRVERELPDGSFQALGKVAGLVVAGAQDLFEVEYRSAKGRSKKWLVPVQPAFIRDLNDERLLVELPIGLLPDELETP